MHFGEISRTLGEGFEDGRFAMVSAHELRRRFPAASGVRRPVAGGRWPVAGGRWPVAGGPSGFKTGGKPLKQDYLAKVIGRVPNLKEEWDKQVEARSVAGGRWPVAGGRWPVAGGRWPVPGGRCPVPGARCPVSGARCPVPGARCPVPGARCPVHEARRTLLYLYCIPNYIAA
jgi:hypothetical protein